MEQQKPTFYFNGIDYNPNFYNTSSNTTNLNNYLLRIGNPISNALSTTFSNNVSINGTLTIISNYITGLTNISTTPITSDNSTKIASTAYVKNQGYVTSIGIQSNNNIWTGTNSFNVSLPTTILTATNSNQIVNFTCLTSQGYASVSQILGNNNTWTGTNTFNTSLPTSTITPTSNTQLITKSYADNKYPALNTQNAFLQLNTFNAFLPTSTITATTANQFCNLTTLQAQGYVTLSSTNIFTNTNTFNLLANMNSIAGLLVTGTYTLYNNLTTGSLRIGSLTSQIYQDAKTQLRGSINLFEVQKQNGGVTLTWPMSQTINLSNTVSYPVTLPIITSSQEGMIFNFVKTQAINISIQLVCQGTNVIQYAGSLTQYTSENTLLYTNTQSTTLICIQTAVVGVYAWQEQVPITTFISQIAALQYLNLSLIGQIFCLLTPPIDTYLICDGTSYLKATYLQLWNAIGYTYGGSGTIFNVPDFRGLFLRGLGTNATNTNFTGSALGTLQTDVIKNHTHSFSYQLSTASSGAGAPLVNNIQSSTLPTVINTSTNTGNSSETRPANQSVIWCIKYV